MEKEECYLDKWCSETRLGWEDQGSVQQENSTLSVRNRTKLLSLTRLREHRHSLQDRLQRGTVLACRFSEKKIKRNINTTHFLLISSRRSLV